MFKNKTPKVSKENILYNNILSLSRNKLFYTKLQLSDTFQNRINLIFIHMSFLFVKIKQNTNKDIYKDFYQNTFDIIFKQIELNMREVGYGDVSVNKKMKLLVKSFYNILLYCENFDYKKIEANNHFFSEYLEKNNKQIMANNEDLINYFHKFQSFCFDLKPNSVLKGEINFKYI